MDIFERQMLCNQLMIMSVLSEIMVYKGELVTPNMVQIMSNMKTCSELTKELLLGEETE